MVVDAVAFVASILRPEMIPGRRRHILATVFGTIDVGLIAAHIATSLACIEHLKERAHIDVYTVMEIRGAAVGLCFSMGSPARLDCSARFLQMPCSLFLQGRYMVRMAPRSASTMYSIILTRRLSLSWIGS